MKRKTLMDFWSINNAKIARSGRFNAGGGSPSVTSRNATAVSHKHRHAPHTLHIDPRTDIMGPPRSKNWNLGLIDPS